MTSEQIELRNRITAAMPGCTFGEPASDAEVDLAQRELGTPFPAWLRSLFKACNGVTAKKHSQDVLWDLQKVVDDTLFMRDDENFGDSPAPEWLERAIILAYKWGSGSDTSHWAALDGKLIEWYLGDYDEFVVLETDFVEQLRRLQKWWDDGDREYQEKQRGQA